MKAFIEYESLFGTAVASVTNIDSPGNDMDK